MHQFASFNHKILPSNDIKINAVSFAGLYGKGVFTTISIYNSKPFLWNKHWRRLNNNADLLDIDFARFNKQKVEKSLAEIIKKNNVINGRCRLTFFDESSSKVWQTTYNNKTSLLIQTADVREIKSENLSLTFSPFIRSSTSMFSNIKSCNYLENIIAINDAKLKGYFEAIRLNEKGEITSGCMANIFWAKDDKLYTPSLKTGCLAGTTRELILEKREVFEVAEDYNALKSASAVFLTSSVLGITQIRKVEGKEFPDHLHSLTEVIKR